MSDAGYTTVISTKVEFVVTGMAPKFQVTTFVIISYTPPLVALTNMAPGGKVSRMITLDKLRFPMIPPVLLIVMR